MKQAVVIKSFSEGIAVHLDPDPDFETLASLVAERFAMSSPFFQDASLAVSFEGRELSFEEECRLADIISANSQIDVACIVGRDEETNRIYGKVLDDTRRERAMEETPVQFYRGTLRAGQLLQTESGVIILGDVEKGASVVCSGNIIVLGRLAGKACCSADAEDHFIAALEMTPQRLKVGDFKYDTEEKEPFWMRLLSFEKERTSCEIQPKMAYVKNNSIILKPITNELLSALS